VIAITQLAVMMFVETALALAVVSVLQVVTATTNDIFLLEKQQSASGNIGNWNIGGLAMVQWEVMATDNNQYIFLLKGAIINQQWQ